MDYTESTKLTCRNSEEGLNVSAFRLAFTALAKFSFSQENTIIYTKILNTNNMDLPTGELPSSSAAPDISGELQEASCLLTLGLTYVQLREPMKTWTRYKTQNNTESWTKMPSFFTSVVQLPSEKKLSIMFLHLPRHKQYLLKRFKDDS